MKREEAIKMLNELVNMLSDDFGDSELCEKALQMAIIALQNQPVWIPVSERLPEGDSGDYPINMVALDTGEVCIGVYRHDSKEWWTRMNEGETLYSTDHVVVAWMPLPEPYRESEPHKQTKADEIRSMTDEELADFIINFDNHFGEEYEGEQSCLSWLQKESEEQ